MTVNGHEAIWISGGGGETYTYQYFVRAVADDPLGQATVTVDGFDLAGNENSATVDNILEITAASFSLPVYAWPVVLAFALIGMIALARRLRRKAFLIAALLLAAGSARADSLSVSNVTFSQAPTATSTQVDIYYDLVAPTGVSCAVTLWLSKDGGMDQYPYPIKSYTSDPTNQTTGTGHHIVWDIRADYPNLDIPNASIRITADDSGTLHTLAYTAGAHGSISGYSWQTINDGSDGTAVRAVPDAGYAFSQWSDGSTQNPRTDTGVTHDISVTANFDSLPVVTSFQIDGGATTTEVTTVTLNNAAAGTPTDYMASESQDFTGASWLPYSTDPVFTLSSGIGQRTVYFKVQNAQGESQAVNVWIFLLPETVWVPEGTFTMGRTDTDDDGASGDSSELPRHEVALSAYQIGKHDVTNKEYCDLLNWAQGLGVGFLKNSLGTTWTSTDGDIFVGGNGDALVKILSLTDSACSIQFSDNAFSSKTRQGLPGSTDYSMDSHPVTGVTWHGAAIFGDGLSLMLAMVTDDLQDFAYSYDMHDVNWSLSLPPAYLSGYRLPTEAEWERAAAWDPAVAPLGKHWIYGFASDALTGENRANYAYDPATPLYVDPLGLAGESYTSSMLTQEAQANWLYSAPDYVDSLGLIGLPSLFGTLTQEAQANNLYLAPDTGYGNNLGIGNLPLMQGVTANYLAGVPYTSPVGWFNGVNISPNGNIATQDSKSPSGCYDMSGNVWQWVNDWQGDYPIPTDPPVTQINPTGPVNGTGRALRGGGWSEAMQDCRTARRYSNTPTLAASNIGFRIARTQPNQPPVVEISAWPSEITYGETATLTWTSSFATTCTLAPDIGIVPLSGARPVSPAATTTYLIVATNGAGYRAMANATVTCYADRIVRFADSHLEHVVRIALGKMTGPIFLADVQGLTSLDASAAGISSLAGLENCLNLTSLDLTGNNISDISFLQGLVNLETLKLSGNPISDIYPLARLAHLTWLELDSCGPVADWTPIAALTGLQHLALSNAPNFEVGVISGLTDLTWLELNNDGIQDLDPLYDIRSLQYLSLANNGLGEFGFPFYLPFDQMVYLDLHGNAFAGFYDVPWMPDLQTLDLSYNDFEEVGWAIGLPPLATFDLSGNDIADLWGVAANSNFGSGLTISLLSNAWPLPGTVPFNVCIEIFDIEYRGVTVITDANVATAVAAYNPATDTADSDGDGYTNAQEWNYLSVFSPDPVLLSQRYIQYVFSTDLHPPSQSIYNLDGSVNIPTARVDISVQGNGTISNLPAGTYYFAKYAVDCPNPTAAYCSCAYNAITLTAKPDSDWAFKSWRGSVAQTNRATVNLTMSHDYSITAVFADRGQIAGIDLISDLDAFLTALGMPSGSYLTFDQNNIQYDRDGNREYVGNGIPDAAELYLLQTVLQDASIDFSRSSGVPSAIVYKAWTQNLTVASQQFNGLDAPLQRVIAAYMTLGDFATVQMLKSLIEHNQQAGGVLSGFAFTTDGYDRTCQQFFYFDNDADNDGVSNIEEWQEASPTNSLNDVQAFALAALDGIGLPAQADSPSRAMVLTNTFTMLSSPQSFCSNTGSITCVMDHVPPESKVELLYQGNEMPLDGSVSFPVGAEVTLKATPDPLSTFDYWRVGDDLYGLPLDADGSRNCDQTITIGGDEYTYGTFMSGIVQITPYFSTAYFTVQTDNSNNYMWPYDYPEVFSICDGESIVELDASQDYWYYTRHFRGRPGSKITVSADMSYQGFAYDVQTCGLDVYNAPMPVILKGSTYTGTNWSDMIYLYLVTPSAPDPFTQYYSFECTSDGMGFATVGYGEDDFLQEASFYQVTGYTSDIEYAAFPAPGYLFKGWKEYSDPAECEVRWLFGCGTHFPADQAPPMMTATFEKAEEYTLNCLTRLTNGGPIQPDAACHVGRDYYQEYYPYEPPYVEIVNLYPQPAIGYAFLKWDGEGVDCSGNPIEGAFYYPLKVAMNDTRTVTAVFSEARDISLYADNSFVTVHGVQSV